jgi:hypothetical protein
VSKQMTSASPTHAGEARQQQSEEHDQPGPALEVGGGDADDVWKACVEHGWFGAQTPDYTFAPGAKGISPGRG